MRFAGSFAEGVFCVAVPEAFGVALFSHGHRTKIQRNKTPNAQRRLAHLSLAAVALLSFGLSLFPTLPRQLLFILPLLLWVYLRKLEIGRGYRHEIRRGYGGYSWVSLTHARHARMRGLAWA